MLGRANDLVERARERIRLAAERDPHAWPVRDDDRSILVHDEDDEHGIDTGHEHLDEHIDEHIAGGDDRAPLGSPAPGAVDVDTPNGGISGPPERVRTPARRPVSRRPPAAARGPPWPPRPPEAERGHAGASVPAGLRIAAAWSWRVILVGALLYLLLQLFGMLLEVFVPLLVALLLAALLQPGAAALVRRGLPRALAALTMLLVGLLVLAGIITLVVNRVVADSSDLTARVSEGLTQVQKTIVRTFPITQNQLDTLVTQAQDAIGANRGAITSGAISTAGTVTQVFTGLLLTL